MPNDAPTFAALASPAAIEVRFERLRADARKEVFEHFLRLAPADLAHRFGAVGTPATLRRYVAGLDFDGDVLLAARDDRGLIVGIAQLMALPGDGGRSAEIAFSVDPAAGGQGLAGRLMAALVGTARDEGGERLLAQVCPDNHPMLRALRRAGMHLRREDGEMVGAMALPATGGTGLVRAA